MQQGQGTIVDFDLTTLKEKQIPYLRRKLGVVFQDFKLLNDRTVKENLKFVLKATGWKNQNEMDDKIDKVLDKVGMKTKGFKYPYQLSGGEQQRVGIARAIVNSPPILLADEPTGNLDPELSMEILRLFEDFNKHGTTVLIATHDLGLVSRMKYRSLTLHDGRMSQDPLAEGVL